MPSFILYLSSHLFIHFINISSVYSIPKIILSNVNTEVNKSDSIAVLIYHTRGGRRQCIETIISRHTTFYEENKCAHLCVFVCVVLYKESIYVEVKFELIFK